MRRALWLLLCLLLPASLPALASTPAEVRARQVEQALYQLQPDLRLSGQGTLRIFGLRIYEARLYVSRAGLPDAMLNGQPYALDLAYARDFSSADIAHRSREEIADLGLGSAAQLRHWEAELARLLPDVKADDHLSGLYRPGQGTLFLLNGQVLGEVPGDDFARAFFSIWLDPRTRAPKVRAALLAGGAGP